MNSSSSSPITSVVRQWLMVVQVALVSLWATTCAQAAIATGGRLDDFRMSMVYRASDGNLSVDLAGDCLSTFQVESEHGYFVGPRPRQIDGLFDAYNAQTLFVIRPLPPFFDGDLDFGPVFPSGLTESQVAGDLLNPGGTCYMTHKLSYDLVYIVPEPGNLGPVAVGLLLATIWRRESTSRFV